MDTTTAKGLTLDVFTTPLYSGCAAGGISERVRKVTVVGIVDCTVTPALISPMPTDSRVFAATDDAPACWLIRRRIGREVWHVAPVDEFDPETGKQQHWYSSGGALVGTSDSRFNQLVGFYGALHLHDRKEW